MYQRVFDIENRLDEGMFLFGGRQVGKSTLLRERFPSAVYVDLLDPDNRKRFKRRTMEFYEMLVKYPPKTLVIVDEIQKLPELLDVVHKLMVEKDLHFILSGSSARKIKKAGVNQLGGRANEEHLYPLVYAEIPDYDFDRAIQNGMIPRHYDVMDARRRLQGYINLYLKEEIEEEALVQDIDTFERFLEVAAVTNTEILDYSNVASDCGVSVNTVKAYFKILYDTLLGFEVKPYRKVVKRKLLQTSKFYYFDVGIPNFLLHRFHLMPETPEYGHAFENLVMQEIRAYLDYTESEEELTYWHTYNKDEVDAVIGDARIAIEIKSTDHVETKHKKGLQKFAEEHPDAKSVIVSRDFLSRRSGDIDLYYVTDFFKALWAGEII
ncbi:MAG: ATP-binding protein [Bacteroidales bacterium]|nr:ATP-binding protein [Bacteroidales bacterium]